MSMRLLLLLVRLCHEACRFKTPLTVLHEHHNILAVLAKNVIKGMAGSTRYGKVRYYGYKPSVHTPVFSDIDKYLPQPAEDSIFSSLKRRYPTPVTSSSIHEPWISNLHTDGTRSSTTTKSTAVTNCPLADQESLRVNIPQEQRTLSVSSGEVLYSTSGHKRPPKRRHHSTATPGFQDDLPVEAKKARRNYSTPSANAARLLRFCPFDAEPPVFTLDTLTEEMQEECQKCVQTMETLDKKLKLKAFLEQTFSPVFPGCSLHLSGSSSNGFGGDSSDADFCLILGQLKQTSNRREALPVLRKMQRLLIKGSTDWLICFRTTMGTVLYLLLPKEIYKYSFGNCSVIPASVPILKFMDPVSGCECDININNTVGVRNTHLLRAYCAVDYRVKPLVVLVKKWAKNHGINDASMGTLSSYALTLMVIHYLQGVCKPAVVPVLQRKYPKLFEYHGDVSNLSTRDPIKHIDRNQSENRQSLGELFLGFFKYYAQDFSWNRDYISIAMGGAYPRFRGQWKWKHICIEEPFDGNNVAKAVCSLDQFNKIHMKFRLAWHTLKISPSLESIKVR